MKGRTFVSLLLIVAAVLAVGYAFFVDRDKVSDTEVKKRAFQVFPVWRKADVTRIELELATGETIVLERDADAGDLEYRMTKPVVSPIDVAAVDRLLSVLEQTNIVRKLDAEPADFGAVRARGRISMRNVQYAFDLAGAAPIPEGSAYLRLDGKALLVVPKDFVLDVLRPADAYRDKTIVPFLSVGLRALSLKSRTRTLELTRQDEISFLVGGPGDNVRASRTTIDRVWTAFAEMRAEKFLSVADARRLTQDPVMVIRMTPFIGGVAEMRLGGPCEGAPDDIAFLLLSPSEVGACVPKGVLAGLSIEAKELVDPGPFVTRIDEVTELVVTDVATGFVLDVARKGGGFRMRAPKEHDLSAGENTLLQGYIERLFALSGMDVTKGASLSVPLLRVVVRRPRGAGLLAPRADDSARDPLEELEVGRESKEGKLIARRSGDGARFTLDESVLGFLRPHASVLRDESVWGPGATADPKEIDLDCGSVQKLRNTDEGWKSTAFPVDQAAAVGLADALRRAKPTTWFHPDSFVAASVAKSKCSIHVMWEGDASGPVTLDLGEKVGNYVLASRRGDHASCLLPADLLGLAKAWYVERAFLRDAASASDIVSLVVTKGARTITLSTAEDLNEHAQGDGGGAGTEGPRSQIATLRATTALQVGPGSPDLGADKVEVKVTLKRDAGMSVRTLTFAKAPNKEGYLLRYDGVPATFELTTPASLASIVDRLR